MHDYSPGLLRVYIDLQAGDGGKGRLVYLDCLQNNPAAVWRYNGGHNAGHTIVFEDGTSTATHIIPAGYFFEGCYAIVGKGCVIDPFRLPEEIRSARETGRDRGNLIIDSLAHVVLPIYVGLDGATDAVNPETRRSTGRGIGPAYMMKAGRKGFRVLDLLDADSRTIRRLNETISFLEPHISDTEAFKRMRGETLETVDAVRAMKGYATIMDPLELRALTSDILKKDRLIIAEGAQGAFLDVDDGEYPYTTSSSCGVAGTYVGTEISHRVPREVVGVFKPYLTRAGKGPVPSLIKDPTAAEYISKRGVEKGTTTGLPRDIGWIDLSQLGEAVAANNPDVLALTKLDVLDGLPAIGICTGYEMRGRRVPYQYSGDRLDEVSPVLEHLLGFNGVSGVRERGSLPSKAAAFLERLERELHADIPFVGTGFGTDDFIAGGRAKHIFRPNQQ